MLNALANHGFLPRDGYNITQEMTETVFLNILNIHPALARKQFQFGLTSVDSPNATAFSLADIRNHNKTEHDGSMRFVMTRGDVPQIYQRNTTKMEFQPC